MKKLLLIAMLGMLSCTTTKTLNLDITKSGVTIVEYKTEWCGACKVVGPILVKLAEDNGAKLIVVDLDVEKDAMENSFFHVPAIPMISIYKNGKLFYHGFWFADGSVARLVEMVTEKE